VVLKGKEIESNSASFYINTGANISIIKEEKLKPSIRIDKEKTGDSRYHARRMSHVGSSND
jgi:hypothetical protein